MRNICKHMLLFAMGGSIYLCIEIIWRWLTQSTPTHWAMFIVGGVVFLLLGWINEGLPWTMPFVWQCLLGTITVLFVEFVSGCILNIWLGLAIWDYSAMPLNILGQICPQFALAWFVLSGVGIVVDDWLRYYLFREERPHYTLL